MSLKGWNAPVSNLPTLRASQPGIASPGTASVGGAKHGNHHHIPIQHGATGLQVNAIAGTFLDGGCNIQI